MSATAKHQITGGDDLDDGLELDPDLLADSGSEDGDGSINGEDLLEMTDEEDKGPRVTGQKRKASEEDVSNGQGEEVRKADKKKQRKEKDKERRAKRMANNPTAITATLAATHLSVEQLSQMFLASIRETFPAATPMEIEDMTIPDDNLLAPPDTPAPSFEHDPFNPLSLRLKALLKPFQSKKPPVQTPRVIILSLSGMRCADVVRAAKPFKGQGEVAKLFAKHFKLEEQVKYLAKTRVSIAVGTPARVSKLLSEGALKITASTIVLLDVTYKDPKQRSLLTLPEIRKELWLSIFSGDARQKLLEGGAKIGAF